MEETFFVRSQNPIRKKIKPKEKGECGGKMELLAAIMETEAIEKILKHLGRPHKPPDIAPASYHEHTSEFSS